MPIRKNELDQLDYNILKALHANARISASSIARQTGTNERTIRKRIERMLKTGAFRLTAILEPEAFGYITAADIFLEVNPVQQEQIVDRLLRIPEINYIAFGQGSNEISLQARFKNNDDLREFIRSTLPNIPGSKVTGYAIVPRILRNIDEWYPPIKDFETNNSENKR